jgi:multiple sugar transport system substrate-binding protein
VHKKNNDLKLRKFKPGVTVNLYQEDWHPFQNLPASIRNFTNLTGVGVVLKWDKLISPELTDKMWNEMEKSFIEEEPPFDLVCADPIIINQYARKERVEKLNNYIENDVYDLTDFEPAALEICTQDKDIYGLPSCNVSNMLMYRVDLFNKYKIEVPKTMEELTVRAKDIQQAVRDDGNKDFYGITVRGATGAGYIGWILASSWAPSWGVDFYNSNNEINIETPEHILALEHFVYLLKKAAPPEEPDMTWTESLNYYESGRAAMIIEVGTEFANLYKKGGAIMENSRCTIIPTGPCGKPKPGLYAPAFSIPKASKVKDAAWELAKFLCSSKQQLEDALLSEAIETASNSALECIEMDKHFKNDFLEVVRASREFATDRRPYSKQGLEPLSILGDEYNLVLRNKKSAQNAMEEAAKKIKSLGIRW